jgi:hypothetical protein
MSYPARENKITDTIPKTDYRFSKLYDQESPLELKKNSTCL